MIDSHAHMDFDDFGPDIDAVFDRAMAAQVDTIVCVGSGRGTASARGAVALASIRSQLWATVGIHPHDAQMADDDAIGFVRDLALQPRVVAIGEVGLDYHYDHSPREAQRMAFRRFVALARDQRKPLVIHTRAAPADTLDILRTERAQDVGGVIHCFTEDQTFADAVLALGFHISFSGILTFKKSAGLREVARRVPADRLLVETDSPYLAPEPHRGKRNEPAFVRHVVEALAAVRGEPFEAVAESTAKNARALFRIR